MKSVINHLRHVFLIGIVFFTTSTIAVAQALNKTKTALIASGAQDRAFWVKTLYKIAYPVIHNLANNTLKKNMATEVAPHYYNNVKEVGYTEALGRTFAGIAPWLSLPDDDTEEGKLRAKFKAETIQALTNAVDPSSADYINFRTDAQPIVDAAYVVQGFMRAPDLWKALSQTTQQRYIAEIKSLRNRTGAYNNWLLFTAIEEAWLLSVGEDYEPYRTMTAINKLNEWYVGDGWYSDGSSFSTDYYNSYVIHPMMIDILKVMVAKKKMAEAQLTKAIDRAARYAQVSERMISSTGEYPPLGRSITYRTAAFQTLGQVVLDQKLPKELSPAQIRCALTKVFENMFAGNQNFDAQGWLVLGFNGHQPEIADPYTCTGSLYMATLGFLPLGLPADNAFWTDAAAPWTARKAWMGNSFSKDHSAGK